MDGGGGTTARRGGQVGAVVSSGKDEPHEVASSGSSVTAVVVSYNSAHHLWRLADALKACGVASGRLLLIDNASRDDSAACGSAAGFEVHRLDQNIGFGAACNVGWRAASTEYVLFCNPDVVPADDAIERLVAALARSSTAAIAGASSRHPGEARRFSRLSSNIWQFWPPWVKRHTRNYGPTVPIEMSAPHAVVDFVEGAFILCRVDALRAVGGFDEQFFLYSEEEDLARRLRSAGWDSLLVPSAIVAHGRSESSVNGSKSAMAPYRFHSLYWYYRRYHHRWYAECARCVLAVCIVLDRMYRRLLREPQLYDASTALAAFRDIGALRRRYERQTTGAGNR